MNPVLHIGGRFVGEDEAMVSILDRGYLLGDGVFATMRGYHGICFRKASHLAEIERGAALLGIPLPEPVERIAELADETARRTGAADAYVRVTLTHGAPGRPPALSLIGRPMDVPPAEAYARGVDAVIVGPRRIPPACLDGTLKTTSYIVQVLGRREVELRGASEGIQLTVEGDLAGGTMASLFLVEDGRLSTPSLDTGCRAGVTRAAILEVARRLGIPTEERRLATTALERADEVFLASTRIECLPVASVDGHSVGKGADRRPLTRRIHDAFRALVAAETAR